MLVWSGGAGGPGGMEFWGLEGEISGDGRIEGVGWGMRVWF